MIYYFGINLGYFIAPYIATKIQTWWLSSNGYFYDKSLPLLCHQYLQGTLKDQSVLQTLANKASFSGPVSNLDAFTNSYLDVFTRGYNDVFGIAALIMTISLIIYLFFRKKIQTTGKAETNSHSQINFKPIYIIYVVAAGVVTSFIIGFFKDLPTGLAYGLYAGLLSWIIIISKSNRKNSQFHHRLTQILRFWQN
jgi:dipeptide/tripeptide permease